MPPAGGRYWQRYAAEPAVGGGGYIEIRPTQDLGEAFARVADELHSQYLLGFAPPLHNGKVHTVNIKILKGDFKARSRKTYVAPKS